MMTPENIAFIVRDVLKEHNAHAAQLRLQRLICQQLGYARVEAIELASEIVENGLTEQKLLQSLKTL